MNEARAQGRRAGEEFAAQKWDACLVTLGSIPSAAVDERKREANGAVAEFGRSRWRGVQDYRDALARLFPDLAAQPGSPESETRLRTQLYNLAVLSFHSGQLETALLLVARVPEPATPVRARVWVAAQLLRLEVLLATGAAPAALTTANSLKAFLRRLSKAVHPPPGWLAQLRLPQRLLLYRHRALLALKRDKEPSEVAAREAGQVWKSRLLSARAAMLALRRDGRTEEALGRLEEVETTYPEGWGLSNTGESAALVLGVDRGCIYGAVGSHNLALLHFQRAAAELNGKRGNSISLFTNQLPPRLAVAYNQAIALSQASQSDQQLCRPAADALLSLLHHFPRNPRLWLRLAETCICSHIFKSGQDSQQLLLLGQGEHRKILVQTRKCSAADGADEAPEQLSLQLAALSLRTALSEVGSGEEMSVCAPGTPLSSEELGRLRCGAETALGFVSLCLGDLHAARELGSRGSVAGRLYSAEAWVGLGSVEKAWEAVRSVRETEAREAGLERAWQTTMALLHLLRGQDENAQSSIQALTHLSPNHALTLLLRLNQNLPVFPQDQSPAQTE